MTAGPDPVDARLLDDWQRDLPLVPRPFAEIAARLDLTEADVIARLSRLVETGAISRVGGVCRPNTVGASTLAAMAVPDWRIDEVAAVVCAEPGVNHAYLREHSWNLWFVATGPDRDHVDAALARIRAKTRLDVLDLRLERPFNVDLGFSMSGGRRGRTHATSPSADEDVLRPDDRPILQAMTAGLALVPRPFAALARALGRSEAEIIGRVRALAEARVIGRAGVIVRHRALGWRSNAMVVWRVPLADIARAGPALAAQPGVTLCYQRRTSPGLWDFPLYCMIHARSRAEAMETLDAAASGAGLAEAPHEVLFSLRCFKQTGALIARPDGEAA